MYNRNKINNLVGLVGFRNPADPDYQKVDTTNQGATSYRYFTDSPYCKIEYILECQEYIDITKKDFNTLLTNIQKKALMDVLDMIFNDGDLLERELIYPYTTNNVEQESLVDGFVGFRIYKDANVAFQINRVLTNFATTGTFTMVLLHSNQNEPLFSQEVTITNTGFQEITLDSEWIVDNTDNFEGRYFLGYIKSDSTPIPYKREYHNSDLIAYFNNMFFETIYVEGHTTNTIFDLDDIDNMSLNTGLNPDISVFDDYTDTILRNKNIIAPAVQMAGQIEMINIVVSSGRTNPVERITKNMINNLLFELEGNPELNIYGLKTKFQNEIKRIRESFNKKKGFKLITAS